MPVKERVIVHLDMDAFFAAVEQREQPHLRGKPVIIGHPGRRGVVATCSYEARRFGVRSAMPSVTAERLCPQAIWVPGRMELYREVSRRVMAMLDDVAPIVEQVSVDEAYADLTGVARSLLDGGRIAEALRARIRDDEHLTASAGIAPCRFLAKVASDLRKPDGQVVLPLDRIEAVLWPLPVRVIPGVGPKLAEKLARFGIATVGDLARREERFLATYFGAQAARFLHERAHGIDERPITPEHERKQISEERTYTLDLRTRDEIARELRARAEGVAHDLRRRATLGRSVVLKVRDERFETVTRTRALHEPTDLAQEIFDVAWRLFVERVDLQGRGVRLLGLGVKDLVAQKDLTPPLFPDDRRERARRVAKAADALRERFGDDAVKPARLVRARNPPSEIRIPRVAEARPPRCDMAFLGRDLTDIHSFTVDELLYILDTARTMKDALARHDVDRYRLAQGRDLLAALLFYENSTRTRTSFEIAALRLGMRTVGFAGTEGTSVQKGESLRHTLDMYEAYLCDTVIMRHPLDGSARFAADHLGVPVFNAGDGKHEHPTQTLLDLFTIREHIGRLEDLDIGIAGDLKYGRTAHSLVIALAKFKGIRVHLFSHETLALPPSLVAYAREQGCTVVHHDSIAAIARAVDILYQTRIQKERMPDLSEYEKAKEMGKVTLEIVERTRAKFGLMHPLPIDKTAPSITPDVDGHPKAIYKKQAGNGVPTRLTELALSLGLIGADFKGAAWQAPPPESSFIEEREIKERPLREDVSIRPIRNNGVVIDHAEPYKEEDLARILRVRERGDIYRAATVRSLSRPGTIKGMLMIEEREFDESDLRAIAAVSPGCTVNIIRGSRVHRKFRLELPERIDAIPGLICTNVGCITRPEHQEAVPPLLLRAGKNAVRCHYCDNLMDKVHFL